MSEQLKTVIDNGEEKVVIFTKTLKGKPHPTGGVYKILIPLSKYKPR